jgi:hypothetical protein
MVSVTSEFASALGFPKFQMTKVPLLSCEGDHSMLLSRRSALVGSLLPEVEPEATLDEALEVSDSFMRVIVLGPKLVTLSSDDFGGKKAGNNGIVSSSSCPVASHMVSKIGRRYVPLNVVVGALHQYADWCHATPVRARRGAWFQGSRRGRWF